jgi:hypothetical protein
VFTGFCFGRPKGKRPLGRSRCRWEDNIKVDLREIGINGAIWIQLKFLIQFSPAYKYCFHVFSNFVECVYFLR